MTDRNIQLDGRELHYVVSEDEFAESDRVLVDIDEREFAVVRGGDGYRAILNFCPHQGGPLGEGHVSDKRTPDPESGKLSDTVLECENGVVSCPWHGYEFDLRDGAHLHSPTYVVPTYDVVVRDGNVYIELPASR